MKQPRFEAAPRGPGTPLESRMIWNRAPHNAFTDLARFRKSWYCTFRESSSHMRGVGRLRLLRSANGREWSSVRLFRKNGVDLRDPKLSLTPGGRLMLVAGGTRFEGDQYVGRRPLVSFSDNGSEWSPLTPILEEGDWLWRVSWHEKHAFGISYRLLTQKKWAVVLLRSDDGLQYEEVCDLGVGGKPNEATIRFRSDGGAVALVRREGGDKCGWVGTSVPPYLKWDWHPLEHRLGGPNFLILPDGRMWAATRIITGNQARTCVGPLTSEGFSPTIKLRSGGDCGYPGMVFHRNRLWLSYYSSHLGKASIYFTNTGLPADQHAQ